MFEHERERVNPHFSSSFGFSSCLGEASFGGGDFLLSFGGDFSLSFGGDALLSFGGDSFFFGEGSLSSFFASFLSPFLLSSSLVFLGSLGFGSPGIYNEIQLNSTLSDNKSCHRNLESDRMLCRTCPHGINKEIAMM